MSTSAALAPSIPVSPREALRAVVRGAYDLQQLRVQTGNRIVANFKAKLGQKPSEAEEELDEESVEILDEIRAEFRLMMDGVKQVKLATFKATPLISNFTEFSLLSQYFELEECEKRHFNNIGKILQEHDFTRDRKPGEPECVGWLSSVKGIGPAMAGVIMSEIDIHKARYPSSLVQYAGLGVEADGRGTSKRSEHLHEIGYTDKDGKAATRMGIRYNPFLKTKLMGVLATSFLRVKDSPYREVYDFYKHRLESRSGMEGGGVISWSEESKGHRHNASLRYMVKIFLQHLYNQWRALEKLPIHPTYYEAKLSGRPHSGGRGDPTADRGAPIMVWPQQQPGAVMPPPRVPKAKDIPVEDVNPTKVKSKARRKAALQAEPKTPAKVKAVKLGKRPKK